MDSITSNLPAIVLVIAGIGLCVMLVMQAMQISQLRQRVDMLTRGVNGESLEGVLDAHLELVHQVSEDLDELTDRTASLETTARHHFARVGLVRFNPFPDTGGNQSFALAMLDESDDGFIVSSLHSRTGTRVYAKSITGGRADNTLSTEEADAVEMASSNRTAARPAVANRVVARPAPAPSRPAPAYRAPEPETELEQRPIPVARPVLPVAEPVVATPEPAPIEPEPVVEVVAGARAAEPEPQPEPAAAVQPVAGIEEETAAESASPWSTQEPAYAEPDEPAIAAAPAPRRGGFRSFLGALRPGGNVPQAEAESEETLPDVAEPAGSLLPAEGAERKVGEAGQSKVAAEVAPEPEYDPDRTGRRPSSIGR